MITGHRKKRRGGVHPQKRPLRRGKSKRWRAAMRARAEAKAAARKRKRDAACLPHSVTGDDAASRFAERRHALRACYGWFGDVVHVASWLVHNCIAHPLLGVAPCAWTVWLHDATADWLNLSPEVTESNLPVIEDRWAWLVHNCIAHPWMGIAPGGRAFSRHDKTADAMGVDGWV